jgi:prepilin-type processing-associated H-X9-DG protein
VGEWPLIADLLVTKASVATGHRDGVNVLYGDGSARWFDRSGFVWEGQDLLSDYVGISASYNGEIVDGLWGSMHMRRP